MFNCRIRGRTNRKKGLTFSDNIPTKRYFQICVGMMGLPPESFWNMSLTEINLAIDGFKEFSVSKESTPMGKDELVELMELYPD